MPSPDSSQLPEDEALAQAIENLEQNLIALKERLDQVKRDEQRQVELRDHLEDLKQQQKNNHSREPIKTELRLIEKQLEEIEINLESRLLNFSAFKEPFWQAVRFGGLGVVLGWLLKSCAG